MQFLTRFFFFNPIKTAPKVEIYIASSAIDFFTWHKIQMNGDGVNALVSEGTCLHLNVGKNLNQIVDAMPDNVNQIAFDGLFIKCTCHRVVVDGTMKKFSAWLNTDNVSTIYSNQPDDCIVYFRSGNEILVCSKLPDFLKSLLEHAKAYKARRKEKYVKKE
jgi:hypothetical protein